MSLMRADALRMRPFLLLVLALSVPFWLADWLVASLLPRLPIQLPVSALMAVVPMVAVWLLRRGGTPAVRRAERGSGHSWWLLALSCAFMPLVMASCLLWSAWTGNEPPLVFPSPGALATMVVVFAVAAYAEEVGWSRYMSDRLLHRGPLVAGVVVGVVWAVWHVIPWLQAGHDARWVLAQSGYTVVARIVIVRLYVRSERALAVPVVFHAFMNVSTFAYPVLGSYYEPAQALIALLAWFVVMLLVGRVWTSRRAGVLRSAGPGVGDRARDAIENAGEPRP